MKRIFYTLFLCTLCLGGIPALAQTTPSREAQLQAELEQIEKEKAEIQKNLDGTRKQTASIQRDVSVLTSEINQLKLNIKEKNIRIEQLGKDINVKTQKIGQLSDQIESGKQSLAQTIKKLNEVDSITLPEIVFASDSLSEALIDVDTFSSVNRSLEDLFAEVRGTKSATEQERTGLDQRRNSELDAKKTIEADQRSIEKKESEKKQLLALSKKQEVSYTQVLADREKRAQQIRNALFELRDTNGVQFGTALEYAKQVSKATGVRPAFLLAILTQETNLGKNIGSCYLTNTTTGSGIRVSTGASILNVMKPTRDVAPFLQITASVGRDPMKTLVSCPQSIGYGGAMGPAQFIPSTWMLFKDRIARALGVNQADPWNPLHAFMASGMYLGDLGAKYATYSAEINAACRYYSGKACVAGTINNTYGTSVMAKAANIQENMIDVLEGDN